MTKPPAKKSSVKIAAETIERLYVLRRGRETLGDVVQRLIDFYVDFGSRDKR